VIDETGLVLAALVAGAGLALGQDVYAAALFGFGVGAVQVVLHGVEDVWHLKFLH
jgi:hypothetical protein